MTLCDFNFLWQYVTTLRFHLIVKPLNHRNCRSFSVYRGYNFGLPATRSRVRTYQGLLFSWKATIFKSWFSPKINICIIIFKSNARLYFISTYKDICKRKLALLLMWQYANCYTFKIIKKAYQCVHGVEKFAKKISKIR